MKSIIPVVFFAAFCLNPIFAQSLTASNTVPAADGIVQPGEYSWSTALKGSVLSLSLSGDSSTLFAALEAPATGWVAIGLGSLKMTGAYMVLGNDDNGKKSISEETGKGFRHTPNAEKILITEAVNESNGKTVLEFSVPVSSFIKDGKLDCIAAWAKKDSFRSRHSKHISVSVAVQ